MYGFLNKALNDTDNDVIEYVIDSAIQDEVIKEIPIVSTIFSVGKIVRSIGDVFLIKKLIKFVHHLKTIDESRKQTFLKQINEDPLLSKKVSEKILFIIENCDEIEKLDLIGKLTKKFIEGDIEKNLFFKLCLIVNRAFFQDIYLLNSSSHSDAENSILFNMGVVSLKNGSNLARLGVPSGKPVSFFINDLGLELKEIL